MENNYKLKAELAKFMVKKLWCKGLITDKEMLEINGKLESDFN